MLNRKYEFNKRKLFISFGILMCATFVIGFLIGFLSSTSKKNTSNDKLNEYYEGLIEESNVNYLNDILSTVDSNRIRNHLKEMTSYPHIAGKEGDKRSADYVYSNWKEQGLDYVKLIDYDVLLSYPDNDQPNSLQVRDANDKILQTINTTEPIIDKELLNVTTEVYSFLAYALNGSVTSPLVYYANYGTEEDYDYLVKEKKINLTNTLVICRYGQIFRGDKVILGQRRGVKGVILYDDPKRTAAIDTELYPNGELLPEEGTQRGSLYTGSGDPLTHMYPSLSSAYRNEESTIDELPKIPATVIGYKHAKVIFELLSENEEVKREDWKGTLKGITYTYGGQLKLNQKLTINVNNYRQISKTYNVIGIIEGTTEPDQYVLVGNHRDAWVLGSVDPTSGTASMLEVSRVLSSLKANKNWRPKRSVVFLSWGAEEYGLLGSTEFVEEFNKKLISNSIAYLNMDISVQGNYSFTAKSSPLLHNLIYETTKSIKFNEKESVYDRWLKYTNDGKATSDKLDKPFISPDLGAGSDYMAFQQRVGIPCLDVRFNHDKTSFKYKNMGSSYALYHTSYETFKLVDEFLDPGFHSFKLITQVLSELARRLSDELVLPFDLKSYSNEMMYMYEAFDKEYGQLLSEKSIKYSTIKETIQNFTQISNDFLVKLNRIDKRKVFIIRQFNDQLKNFEKSFLDFHGVKRAGYLHMLSAPSLFNQYGGDSFPSLSDAVYAAIRNDTHDEWEKVKFEISLVIYVIQSAIHQLQSPINFERF